MLYSLTLSSGKKMKNTLNHYLVKWWVRRFNHQDVGICVFHLFFSIAPLAFFIFLPTSFREFFPWPSSIVHGCTNHFANHYAWSLHRRGPNKERNKSKLDQSINTWWWPYSWFVDIIGSLTSLKNTIVQTTNPSDDRNPNQDPSSDPKIFDACKYHW